MDFETNEWQGDEGLVDIDLDIDADGSWDLDASYEDPFDGSDERVVWDDATGDFVHPEAPAPILEYVEEHVPEPAPVAPAPAPALAPEPAAAPTPPAPGPAPVPAPAPAPVPNANLANAVLPNGETVAEMHVRQVVTNQQLSQLARSQRNLNDVMSPLYRSGDEFNTYSPFYRNRA